MPGETGAAAGAVGGLCVVGALRSNLPTKSSAMMYAATVHTPTTTWTRLRAVATLAATLIPPASTRGTSAQRLVRIVTVSLVRTIRAMIARLSTVIGVIHSLGMIPNSGSR